MGLQVNLELDGEMGDYVAAVTDGSGWYASVEEYVRDLIRKNIDDENAKFEAFKAKLREAAAAPESSYVSMTADEFLSQMKSEAE